MLQATSQAFSAIHSTLGTNGRYFKSLLGINPYSFGIFPYTNEPFTLFTKFHKYASVQIELSFAFANAIMTKKRIDIQKADNLQYRFSN